MISQISYRSCRYPLFPGLRSAARSNAFLTSELAERGSAQWLVGFGWMVYFMENPRKMDDLYDLGGTPMPGTFLLTFFRDDFSVICLNDFL